MNLVFRKAKSDDFQSIWEIISFAKEVRKNQGSQQWQDGYPNEETITNDIAQEYGYVVQNQNEILGYFALIFDEDPTYKTIEGKWLSDQEYAVVHRVAVSANAKGLKLGTRILSEVEKIGADKKIFSIRIDTNFDNIAMLSILEKLNYQYCGEIDVRGSARKAFQKILK